MAAEMVSSAVAQEAVKHVLSRFKEQYQGKSDAKELTERMEMAHIKLEAALDTSNKWNVTSEPLVRWQRKLKRATQECDDTLRRSRQRLQEEEEVQERVRNSSFPMRIAHTTRSFISSIFYRGNNDGNDLTKASTAVRRFEWYADGASEFLRYVELGGTPRLYMFLDSLVHHLLAGKGTKYCFVHGGQHLSFVLQPFSLPEHGMEGCLIFLLEDANAPENNFLLSLSLWLSESTDIVGVAFRCLQLFTPHLSSIVETVKSKLAQLPTRDLCWVSNGYSDCGQNKRLDKIRTMSRKWFRPNLLCCQQQDHQYSQSYASSSTSTSSESSQFDIYLEPVNQVYLLGHVALSAGSNRQRAVVDNKTSLLRDVPYLKLGGHFWPHASSKELSPAVGGSATEMINGKAAVHGSLYANISFDQLGKIMLPKAADCLCKNVAGTSYQMLWKSKHGGAYLQVEKASWGVKHPKQRKGKKVQGWASANYEFMSSWIAHASAQLQGSILDWAQKEKRLPLSLLSLKTDPCTQYDCPIKLWSSQDRRSWARKIKSSCTFHA